MSYKELKVSSKSWKSDFHLENGNYINKCLRCNSQFIGHKSRVMCRDCSVIILKKIKIGDLQYIKIFRLPKMKFYLSAEFKKGWWIVRFARWGLSYIHLPF